MDEAAPQAASGTVIDGPQDDPPWPPGALLAAIRWSWDGAYMITGHPGGGLLVARADGHGSFHVDDPFEARDVIRADYALLHVARPLNEGALGRRLAFEKANPKVAWSAPSRYHKTSWTDAAGRPQQEMAPSVEQMLRQMRRRGFAW